MKLKPEYINQTPESRLYNLPCPVIGLTGGIATGKSTVSSQLEEQGFHIICADKLVKTVYQSHKTIEHLKSHYPQMINDNEVNFKELRKLFFSDKSIQEDIEALIYSQMPETFKNEFHKFASPKLVIYDVPLLFEKSLAPLVDLKVTVYAPKEVQVSRLMTRDNIDETLANEIISKQMDIEEKKSKSDLVINNYEDLDTLKTNIKSFVNNILTN